MNRLPSTPCPWHTQIYRHPTLLPNEQLAVLRHTHECASCRKAYQEYLQVHTFRWYRSSRRGLGGMQRLDPGPLDRPRTLGMQRNEPEALRETLPVDMRRIDPGPLHRPSALRAHRDEQRLEPQHAGREEQSDNLGATTAHADHDDAGMPEPSRRERTHMEPPIVPDILHIAQPDRVFVPGPPDLALAGPPIYSQSLEVRLPNSLVERLARQTLRAVEPDHPAPADVLPAAAARVLVAITGNELDHELMALACAVAQKKAAAVDVIYGIEVPRSKPVDDELPLERARADWALDQAVEDAAACGIPVDKEYVQTRDFGYALVSVAATHSSALLVIGLPYEGDAEGQLEMNAVVDYVLKHAPCRVWVIRGQPPMSKWKAHTSHAEQYSTRL